MSMAMRGSSVELSYSARPRRTLQKLLAGVFCFSVAFAIVPFHRSLEDPTAPFQGVLLSQNLAAVVGVTAAVSGLGALVGHCRVAFLLFMVWVGLPVSVSLIFSSL